MFCVQQGRKYLFQAWSYVDAESSRDVQCSEEWSNEKIYQACRNLRLSGQRSLGERLLSQANHTYLPLLRRQRPRKVSEHGAEQLSTPSYGDCLTQCTLDELLLNLQLLQTFLQEAGLLRLNRPEKWCSGNPVDSFNLEAASEIFLLFLDNKIKVL